MSCTYVKMCMWMDKSACINVIISLEIMDLEKRIIIKIFKIYFIKKSRLKPIIENYWFNQKQ